MDGSSPETWRWIWLVAAAALTIGEITVAGSFFLLPFAVGALAAAVLAFAGAPVAVEWLLFVVVSAAAVGVMRPLARRLDRGPQSRIGANRWVGSEGVVLRDIPAGPGATGIVRIDREEWRAESLTGHSIPAGSTALVSRVDGTRLVVVQLEPPSPMPIDPGTESGSPS